MPPFSAPPSPTLSPEEALRTFRVAPGFRIELVASEPLVEDPVAIAFDPDGRIWAVEMRGWMNDIDGAGNDQPTGRIVTLEDTDGDGRMDRSTVFIDGLVMPRAVQLARDGVLIAAPPFLWFCRDTDGDGRADEKIVLADDYMNFPTPQANPEADPNGLLWNIDNWLYSARYSARFRYRAGRWERQPAPMAGQWGLSQDDYGRHFFNTNQDQLRANPLPIRYAARNPHLNQTTGCWNARVATDQRVWPIRVSPGANRGYRADVLRPDGTLRLFEAACGPAIYRGGLFPQGFDGNGFVADPVGHIVKRNIVSERQGIFAAEHAYAGHEFLSSTDERFRPVNLYTGPEGGLYVVDMYRGVIEYIHVMTTYLRRQILERGLDRPLGLGRIYRIVPDRRGPFFAPKMANLSATQLVACLTDANGWRRDTAQRLLVERADFGVVSELKALARISPLAVGRLHALWTLEGLEQLDESTVLAALADPSEKVRAAAVRLAEPWLRQGLESEIAIRVLDRMHDPAADVLLQLALSLGEAPHPAAGDAMIELVFGRSSHPAAPAHPYMAAAIASGLRGRELEFLDRLLARPELKASLPGAADILAALAGAIFQEGELSRIERVFARIGDCHRDPSWVRLTLISGIGEMPRKKLAARPENITEWEAITDPAVRKAALELAAAVDWPGRNNGRRASAPQTAEQWRQIDAGRREYALCATCHLPTGQGLAGLAPSLVGSRWVLGPAEALVRIVLHGKKEYSEYPPMPAFSHLDDERIASILTYIRHAWGHVAGVVEAELVARVRREIENHEGPFSKDELEKLSTTLRSDTSKR